MGLRLVEIFLSSLQLERLVGDLLLQSLDLALEDGLVLRLELFDSGLVGAAELLDGGLGLGAKLLQVLTVDVASLVLSERSRSDTSRKRTHGNIPSPSRRLPGEAVHVQPSRHRP